MARKQPLLRPTIPGGESLRESERVYRLLVESVADYAIFLLDPEGFVQTWNRGAKRLKGYSEEEIVGEHFSTFYTEKDKARRYPQYELTVAAAKGRFEDEGWRLRKDGSLFWANVVITALREEGELVGFAKVTRDLTERKRTEEHREKLLESERRARAAAEEADRAKTDFLAVVSHELRTPLNAISGYAELILSGIPEPVPDGVRRKVERIRTAAEYQLHLVEEILAFSDLESGGSELARARVDLAGVAGEVAELVEPLVRQSGLSLHLELPDQTVVTRTDAVKVRQILKSLLSNAVKFSPEGELRLELETEGESALFHVRDCGIGIAPEDRERIFDPFWQADQSSVREVGGMGLGLAVCRRLARRLNGDIEVESQPGRGSTFTLRLPLAQASDWGEDEADAPVPMTGDKDGPV